jgi:hypothetical protein
MVTGLESDNFRIFENDVIPLLHNLSLAKTSGDPELFYFVLRDIPLCRRSRDRLTGNDTALCALGVRYKFGTTEREKEWLSGSQATPDKALGFFDFVVGIQEVGG